jgi:hypothetical protein
VSTTPATPGETAPSRDNRLLYAGVIVVEALVLLVIWLIQRHFGT